MTWSGSEIAIGDRILSNDLTSFITQLVKNSSVYEGDTRDVGSIPGQGISLEKKIPTCSSIHAWKIPQTEEPGGLYSPCDLKESDMTECACTYACTDLLNFHSLRATGFMRIFREKEFRKVSSAPIPDWLPCHPGVSQRTGYSLRTMLGGRHTLQPLGSREEPQASRGPRYDNFQESCLPVVPP